MGFCIKGDNQYDTFLSYAHADNEFYDSWVGDFEKYLKGKTIAALQRSEAVNDFDARMFEICRDETGFPEGGRLDEIIDELALRKAQEG